MDPTITGRTTRGLSAKGLILEFLLATAVALSIWWFGTRITLDATLRTEQVSALAQLQLSVALLVSVPLVILVYRSWKTNSPRLFGLGTAVVAGLSSGLVAGSMAIALTGTRCPVNSLGGDAGRLVIWAATPGTAPPEYPPLPVLSIRFLAQVFGTPEAYVWKTLSILLLAMSGPLLYAGWRLLCGPALSLALGPFIGLVFIDPYKPYSSLALCLSLIVLAVMAFYLRKIHVGWQVPTILGLTLSAIVLTYPGWLVWMLPGFLVFLVLLPWRQHWRPLSAFLGTIGLTVVATSFWWLFPAWEGFRTLRDTFVYADVWLRPTYFAAWQDDTPAFGVKIPPFGEFAGMDSFSLVLMALVCAGLILRGRTTLGVLCGLIFAGTWLRKMQIASAFRESGLVQLFPRANFVLLLVALTIAVLGVAALIARIAQNLPQRASGLPAIPLLLVVCGVLLVPSLAEATTDDYMASESGKGVLTLRALTVPCWPIPEDAQPWVPE